MIAQTGEYALRAAVFLAHRGVGRAVSAQEISSHTGVPVGYLQKVLRLLSRAGLLTSQRGLGGGFALAKIPTAISVDDVLNAVGAGIQRVSKCPLGIQGHTSLCPLHRLLDEQFANTEKIFKSTSIAVLADSTNRERGQCGGVIGFGKQ